MVPDKIELFQKTMLTIKKEPLMYNTNLPKFSETYYDKRSHTGDRRPFV